MAIFPVQGPTIGLCMPHFTTMVTWAHLAIHLGSPEHHRCWTTVARVPILRNFVVGNMTILIRTALEAALMLLHTCALVVVATRHCTCLLHTCISTICQLAGFVKCVWALQHHPVLHGRLQSAQENITC